MLSQSLAKVWPRIRPYSNLLVVEKRPSDVHRGGQVTCKRKAK